jgi:hypothetical protein
MVLVEPDARLVAKILAPLHRASQVGKMEREKVRQLGVTRRKKLRLAMQSLENTMDASLKRTQRHIEFERKKRQQQKKLLERRYKIKSEPRQRDRERRLRREALRQQFKQQNNKKP